MEETRILSHTQEDLPMERQAGTIGPKQLRRFLQALEKYKAGRATTEVRILSSENWWKLRNTEEEQKVSTVGTDGGFTSQSGWLHNVIVSKHADAMESYPEPNILPREEGDKQEAQMLSSIIPCVLEQNHFEQTYSDTMWQKQKTGTGVYKIVWDTGKLNGLGDIAVEQVNLLNVYWEPGVKDIQKSRYFFHTELVDKDVLEETYPHLAGKIKGKGFMSTKFLYDDHVDTENKHTVVDVYYHRRSGGKQLLHYCKFVGDQVLYASEDDPQFSSRGYYDHGRYPYVFDPLFPIEGSPCGYGYVDICRNPQIAIDIMNTAFLKNTAVGAIPRFLAREESAVNEADFLNLNKPIVRVPGDVSENAYRQINFSPLDGVYVNFLDRTIQELRETSGNTETSTGNIQSGVTAASAIAALQEASGKGSRDSTQASYRAYTQIIEICIELIRQFYTLPRTFRILGEYGAYQYKSYTNAGIRPQHQGNDFGKDMGYRIPEFDIKVSAQKKNAYTKVAQNELAIQFFQLGFFNPQMADQALMCLEMMEFDGKDGIMQKVVRNATLLQKLIQYMQMALSFAQVVQPELVEGIVQDLMQTMGSAGSAGVPGMLPGGRGLAGMQPHESTGVENARRRSSAAAQPGAAPVRKEKQT